VADPFGTDCESGADRLGTRGFSGVGCESQTGIARVAVSGGKRFRWSADFVSADSEGDDSVIDIAGGEAGDFHHVIGAELADGIEVPVNFDGALGLQTFTLRIL